jgi:hypothetical protein
MALSNLKLHETLRSQSIRDPHGLFNRHFMEDSRTRLGAPGTEVTGVIMC